MIRGMESTADVAGEAACTRSGSVDVDSWSPGGDSGSGAFGSASGIGHCPVSSGESAPGESAGSSFNFSVGHIVASLLALLVAASRARPQPTGPSDFLCLHDPRLHGNASESRELDRERQRRDGAVRAGEANLGRSQGLGWAAIVASARKPRAADRVEREHDSRVDVRSGTQPLMPGIAQELFIRSFRDGWARCYVQIVHPVADHVHLARLLQAISTSHMDRSAGARSTLWLVSS